MSVFCLMPSHYLYQFHLKDNWTLEKKWYFNGLNVLIGLKWSLTLNGEWWLLTNKIEYILQIILSL